MTEHPTLHAAIFDMDGVLTDTARAHARAWRELLPEVLREAPGGFDEERDYRRHLEGRTVHEGLASLLAARGIQLPPGRPGDLPGGDTVWGLIGSKDEEVRRLLEEQDVEVFPAMVGLARELARRGLPTAVASSSRHCADVLDRAGIAGLFSARVDGGTLQEAGRPGKPAPDGFLEAARRLGVEPRETVVFEDAAAGVTAARRGAFGLVVGVASDEAARVRLREAGADLLLDPTEDEPVKVETLEAWFTNASDRLPNPLTDWEAFTADLGGREPAFFLDYDGTLAGIARRPSEAVLPDFTRQVVERLARRFSTVVVSGRGREDVAALAGLRNAGYAGSHGFDIEVEKGNGPPLRHRVAEEIVPVIAQVSKRLEAELAGVEGALVEPKSHTVAVHYRLVEDGEVGRVEAAVDGVLADHPELRKAHGKKVFEIRPAVDWHKGRAVEWLLETLGLDRPDVVPLYVGDDETDEDAFRAVAAHGIGVLVSLVPRPTAARYTLQDPVEVREFLRRLEERA